MGKVFISFQIFTYTDSHSAVFMRFLKKNDSSLERKRITRSTRHVTLNAAYPPRSIIVPISVTPNDAEIYAVICRYDMSAG